MVGLFYVSILMGNAGIIPGRLHAVVGHECMIALGPIFSLFCAQVPHSCAQMVGAMLLWNPADLPKRFLDPFGEGLKALAEADARCFRVGVGEHKMEDQVRKRFIGNRDAEILHVSEIRLRSLAWDMSLLKDDLLGLSIEGAPAGDMPLQGGITCELLHHPGPVLLKWVHAGLPIMWEFELAREFPFVFILASRAFTHARTSSSDTLGKPFSSFRHIQLDLVIVFHMTPSLPLMVSC